ncbi:hypothetical protein LMIY3S_01029 [Labrys miyagiensis]
MPTKQARKPEGETTRGARAGSRPRKHGETTKTRQAKSKWSDEVTRKNDALDLEKGVFTSDSPGTIARSLKRSADASRRRKTDPFRSALSMLTFYINRAGKNLSKARRGTLTAAKDKLRQLFGRKRKLSVKRVQ